jgi:ATP-dependent exoDNAse (exonuclease V) beta subunit
MKFGLKLHSVFEQIDLLNPDYSNLTNFESNKVSKFINSGILNNVVNIYKEHEFLYEEDGVKYHGIIDLLLEYNDEFKIVDYKLKNIKDDAYLKQLNGYKKYIESITDKKVDIYLYSIIDETLQKL